jgi:hypothetical protein
MVRQYHFLVAGMEFHRYRHERHGTVETLTQHTVTYVRPCFGLPRRAHEPASRPSRTRRLGKMWKPLSGTEVDDGAARQKSGKETSE